MIEYLIILLLSFPPLLWFRQGFVLFGHDSGFRFDRWAQLPNLFYSWDPKINFGVDWSMFKGFLVTQLPETILGQQLSLVFWFAVMGIGMLVFLRNTFPEKHFRFFRLFTSVFYMYNFFILSGWTIGERAKFSLYAALPVGILLVYKVLVQNYPVFRAGVLFGLLYFLLNGGGIFPLFGGAIVAVGTAFLVFGRGKSLVRILKTMIAFLIPFLFLNAYYIIPNIGLLFSSYGTSVGAQGGVDGLIAWERVISQNSSISNLLRLQGLPGWFDPSHPFSKPYITNPFLVMFSYLPSITIIIGLFVVGIKRKLIRYFVTLLPIGLLLTMGTHPPTGILYEMAMKYIPGFVMFRSSFYKFAPALWISMIMLSGYYANELIRIFIKNRVIYFAASTIILIGLLTYHFPYFGTGAFVIDNNFSTRLQVPSYILSAASQIKRETNNESAILVMPKLVEYFPDQPVDTYSWDYFGLDILPRNAIGRRFIANDSHNPLVDRLYEAIYKGDQERTRQLSKTLAIGYILWRGDALLTISTIQEDDPSIAKKLLDASFTKVRESGNWSLYRLAKESPLVFASGNYFGFEGTDEGAAYFTEIKGTIVSPGSDILEAECVMCKDNEYSTLVTSIVPPKTRITPASILFPLEKWRGQLLLDSVKNEPKKRIDATIATAQKYLSWGDKDTFSSLIKDAVSVWAALQGRDKIYYANRLTAYLDAAKERVPSQLINATWKSDASSYRYIVPMVEGYEMVLSDTATIISKEIRDGFLLVEVRKSGPAPYLYMQKKKLNATTSVPSVSYKRINPTKYVVNVSSTDPYLLILQEQYDTRWKTSVNGIHVRVNTYANGWIIEKTGNYELTISYEPQQFFIIGLWVTGISLIGALYYLMKK